MATAACPEINAELSSPGLTKEPESKKLPAQQVSRVISPFRVPATIKLIGKSARPRHVLFGALKDPKLRLRQPIPLDVSVEQSEVIVTWVEADEFGCGATTGTALDDFGHTVRELYERLHAKDAQLGTDLQRVKQILGNYIEPRQ